jgi:ankyrin repeat protein
VVDPANRVSIALEAIRVWLERIAGTKEQAEQLFVLLRHGGPFPHLDAFLARLPQATAAVDRVLCEVGLVSEETAALFPRTAHTQRLCANILLDEEEEEMLRCHAGIALAHMGAAALQQHTQALERIAETVLPRPAPPAVRYAAYRCLLSLWTEAGVLKQKLAAADAEGRTMLMRGAQYGNAKMVAVLVDAGADVKLADRGGRTALHFAAGSGDATTIRVLLDAGADAQVRDEETLTPLMVAAASGHAEACRVLVEEGGAGVEDVDHSKATPLMLAAKGGHTEAIRALLALRAEVNVLDVAGRTPLMWAALSGRGSALNALLDAGADITVVDLDGYNAIIHAAERGHADALTSLLLTVDRQLAAGRAFVDFSINDQLPTGRNALMLAAAGGHKFAVRALIRARADPFITDGVLVGRTALDYAAANAHLEVATMLREYMDRRAVQEADDLAAIERDARADIRARETGGDRDADLGANVSFVRLVEHMWA